MAKLDSIAVTVAGGAPQAQRAAVLALPVFEEQVGAGAAPLRGVEAALGRWLLPAIRDERFEGKPGQQLLLPTLGRGRAERVLLLGLGSSGSAGDGGDGFEALRMAAGKAARAVPGGRLVIALPEVAARHAPAAARAAVEGALLGAYRFEAYRARPRGSPRGLSGLTLAVPAAVARRRDLRDEVALARRLAVAVAAARDLVNLGPAQCTPRRLAEAAARVARRAGLACQVRGERQIAALRMGLFLGVTRGSAEPPRLVTLAWRPPGRATARPVVLVGKAVTFDSGGLSLKPTESMTTMHTDMAGSAAVIAAMQVVAALRPPFPVIGVFGACENMPGGRAYKPSDVLTAFDGQTVEITNTDAEGRLVLGDVLAWAARTFKPAALVDVATLTGACMVALGPGTAGALGPDGAVIDGLLAAARRAGEDAWRLPLVELLKEQLKSDRADLKNTGDRLGGAITAAHFLHRFVGETPWAHLDIAGPSHTAKERGYLTAGGTGFAVRTLVEFVRGWTP
jgi:leucyl aminopeptidase